MKGRLWRGVSKYDDGPDCDATDAGGIDWERTAVVLALVDEGSEVQAR